MRRFLPGFLAGGLVVAGVAWFLWPDQESGPAAPLAPPPSAPASRPPPRPMTPEQIAAAKADARRILETVDADAPDAHATLGHMEFSQPIPEAISYMGYPFVRIVEEANAKRWFDDAKEWNRAMRARERTLQHARRLETDRVYRCLDGARANVDRDEYMRDYIYATYSASPYLICYTDGERIDAAELEQMSPADRAKRLDAADAKRASWRKILAEKGRILQQLYAEFLRRYGEACDLHDLMAAYGGRPDYGVGKRSYADGCPLIVWIFSDKRAWMDYHVKVKRDWIDERIDGYFSESTGWVFSYGEEPDERGFEFEKILRRVTQQLLFWFEAQRNEWGQWHPPERWLWSGLADHLSSAAMDRDRRLTFSGLNRTQLLNLQRERREFEARGRRLPMYPAKELLAFPDGRPQPAWLQAVDGAQPPGYEAYAQRNWGVDPGVARRLYRAQSYALVHFLLEGSSGERRPTLLRYLEKAISGEAKPSTFGHLFGVHSDQDWAVFDLAFAKHYRELQATDISKLGAPAPALDDWPTYVPTED